MGNRLTLQNKLESIMLSLGYSDADERVYFQPPNGTLLKYPCIVYNLEGDTCMFAEDKRYRRMKRYGLSAIATDPDSPLQDVLLQLQYCSYSNTLITDNLYHYNYTLYY